jgi:hypothetical protein
MKGVISDMEKEIKKSGNEIKSLAYEMLEDSKRKSKRDFIIILVLSVMLFASNLYWINFINQYDIEQTTVDSTNGIATYLENSNAGDINYGENQKD